MKKIFSLVALLLLAASSYAHVWEIRVNQNQNGSLTWYLQSYHSLGQCGIQNSGLTINGVNYPLQSEHAGSITGLSSNVFAVTGNYARGSYAIVNTPFLGTTLSVQPYSSNVCWAFLVGGSGNFTPPPPPVCTSCPITGWSNTTGVATNSGTACDPEDDILPTTVTVNHLSCASITTGGQFKVIYDPGGANISYGPYNFSTGITTDVNINLPYGVNNSTQLTVVSDSFPCSSTGNLSIPGGTFAGVPETVPPVITCPANVTVNNDPGNCGAIVNYSLPTATDNCSTMGAPKTMGFNGSTWYGPSYSEQGMTITATYGHVDIPWPTATGQGARIHGYYKTSWSYNGGQAFSPISVYISANATDHEFVSPTGAKVSPTSTGTFTFPNTPDWRGITSMQWNNKGGNYNLDMDDFVFAEGGGGPAVMLTSAANTASGSSFPLGTTTVSYKATDAAGNTANCSFTVTVVDNEAPSITAPANVTVNADNGMCAATNVALGTPATSDNCGVAGTSNNAPTSYPVGTTTVTWIVNDVNGNANTATQTVTVIDNQVPSITAPADVTVNADNGLCSASGVALGSATASDNCGVAGTSNNAPSSYPVGTTTVTWTATDVNGNTNTATQNITVIDNQAPNTVCKNYTLNLSNGAGTVLPSDVDNGSTDNCSIASMSVSPNSFTCANAGDNTVTLTVTDVNGNSSSCNAVVTVQYQPSCSITTMPSNNTYTGGNPNTIYLGYGPQSATITANATGGSGFTYSWSPSTGLSNANVQSPVFTPTAAGNYTYTVTVTNSNGCSTTCTVSFCVLDIRVPGNKGKSSGKVYICHVPGGNLNKANTLSVSVNAVATHLSQHSGDKLGKCDQSCSSSAAKGGKNNSNNIEEASSLEQIVTTGELKIYPNPNSGTFRVELPTQDWSGNVIVRDMLGKEIKRISVSDVQQTTISIPEVASGVYMVEVSNTNEVYRARLVIKR